MKKVVLGLLAATLMLGACKDTKKTTAAQDEAAINMAMNSSTPNPNLPVMKFDEQSFDFGKITQGDSVMHRFKFTNTGKLPLIVKDAIASCGCTVPEWPKDPIQPGDDGEIKVTFHSVHKSGLQDKLITITANTFPAQNNVHLTGEVIVK